MLTIPLPQAVEDFGLGSDLPAVDSFLVGGDAAELLKREAEAQVGVSKRPILAYWLGLNI